MARFPDCFSAYLFETLGGEIFLSRHLTETQVVVFAKVKRPANFCP